MKIAPVSRLTVYGNSMFPTLHPGQDVLSFNWAYLGRKPKIGDVVVVKIREKEMVKRIQKVEDCDIFVQGDNLAESTDSRHFGAVNVDQVVGKVVYRGEGHPELVSGSGEKMLKQVQHDRFIPCPKCGSAVVGIYGRKDAVCKNCGFKLACCGEP